MPKKFKYHLLTSKLFISFLYHFTMLYSRTLRLKIENQDEWEIFIKNGKPVILCCWHQQFLPMIRRGRKYEKYNPAIMISQSRDGELISAIADLCGWRAIRGSSSRGGKRALVMMVKHIKNGGLSAHILDGPQGPLGVAKPGIIQIAALSGAALVPVGARAENAWYIKGSWDRFMIPKPFSKTTVRFGSPIQWDKPETEEEFEKLRRNIEDLMPELNVK